MSMPSRRAASMLTIGALLVLGCRGTPSHKPPIHPNPNMDLQPKLRAQAPSDFFYNGAVMQPPVEGTVARGSLARWDSLHTGRTRDGELLETTPLAPNPALLERGAERFAIFCSPCHGPEGGGNGEVVRRAEIESADLRTAPVKGYSDGRLFEIITDGSGLMQGYRHPVPAEDRWAIVAHLRRLQERAVQ
ncbi:MAG TPA: cytochrome c [Thermoanaerobaculia bacterium]|nr:cytochrome c [Thermoanaerobaculia bacterium]